MSKLKWKKFEDEKPKWHEYVIFRTNNKEDRPAFIGILDGIEFFNIYDDIAVDAENTEWIYLGDVFEGIDE